MLSSLRRFVAVSCSSTHRKMLHVKFTGISTSPSTGPGENHKKGQYCSKSQLSFRTSLSLKLRRLLIPDVLTQHWPSLQASCKSTQNFFHSKHPQCFPLVHKIKKEWEKIIQCIAFSGEERGFTGYNGQRQGPLLLQCQSNTSPSTMAVSEQLNSWPHASHFLNSLICLETVTSQLP